jgi:hypothetical protein
MKVDLRHLAVDTSTPRPSAGSDQPSHSAGFERSGGFGRLTSCATLSCIRAGRLRLIQSSMSSVSHTRPILNLAYGAGQPARRESWSAR